MRVLAPVFIVLSIASATPVATPPTPQERVSLPDLIDGVERRLASIRDLSAEFTQVYEDSLNQTRSEQGHVYLRRPRQMRWEYRTPEEKLFVSDGKTVYLWIPAAGQVLYESVGDSFDERIPLMYLLGRQDLESEFERIAELRTPPKVAGARVLQMYPRRESDVEAIILEVDPVSFDIRRLSLTRLDGSVWEVLFDEVQVNGDLEESFFEFEPPVGAQVIEGIGG